MQRQKFASLIRVSCVLALRLLVVMLGGLLKPEAAVEPVSFGANGTLSGTPTAAGTYAIRVGTTAANGPSSEKDLRLTEMSSQTESDWILKSPANSPSPRFYHAMAYDAARGDVVLFGGGTTNGSSSRETWVWDGTNWTQKSPTNSPTGRSSHAMAYDAARGQVVLFGGHVAIFVNDTWVWDGTTWISKSPANRPAPREDHAMAYDAARGQVVLFGGEANDLTRTNDTWVWDGTNWIQKSPANSPTPRDRAAMAYDAARGQVVLFGGEVNDLTRTNETWVWDGTNWIQKSPANSPPPLQGHKMAYDAANRQVVLFGGATAIFSNDTWVWDGANWTQKSPTNRPVPRSYHAMAYDAARGQVVLFGGFPNGQLGDDTWVFTASQCDTGSFGAKTDFGTGSTPDSVAVGDFNGDGKLDLAVANRDSDTVSVLLGTGTGSFGARTDFGTGSSPESVAVGDFNGDGKLDLAVANDGDATVSILLGTGTGSFGAKTDFGTGDQPTSVAVGDFNGDGKFDLAVANFASATVSILLGTGTGSFGANTDFGTGGSPVSVAVGDFNGDGKLDLAVANRGDNAVSILLGTGTGSFGAKTDFGTGVQPNSVAVGDFNGDGKLDLAVANLFSNTVSILLGTGTGSFGAKTDFGTGFTPLSVAVGDFNGDGKLDLAVAPFSSNTVSILLGTGTGSFGAKTDFGTGTNPLSVAVGDFNGDGNLDLAVTNRDSATVSILLNTCSSSTSPSITANPITRTAGSPSANSQIATVNDAQDARNTLTVTVNGGTNATVNGVTVSGISVNAAGVVTADVVAACGATTANFTLRVTDSGGLFNEATLTVTVNADNQPPTITCPANITTTTAMINDTCRVVTYAAPASDNCPSVTAVCAPSSGSCFPVGTTTVTCTATKGPGVAATCSFTVTVDDGFNCQVDANITLFHQADQVPEVPQPYFGGIHDDGCRTNNYGCALLTSSNMLRSFGDSFLSYTAKVLDTNLVMNGGYEPRSCRLRFDRIPQAVGGVVKLVGGGAISRSSLDNFLDKHFCQNDERVIVKLTEYLNGCTESNRSHFILVTGKKGDGDWEVFDPGWKNASPPEALKSLEGHFTGFTTFSSTGPPKARKFCFKEVIAFAKSSIADPRSLSITGLSPVELLVIDPQGRGLGYLDGTYIFDIPNGSYLRDFPLTDDDGTGEGPGEPTGVKTAYIAAPQEGMYHLEVSGTGSGEYTLEFRALAMDGTAQDITVSGMTHPGLESTYVIEYSSTPGAALRVFGITATPVTRNAGNPSVNSQIALVDDAQGAPNTLSVTVNGGTSATVNGVTVTLNPTAPNASGQVFADVVAACTATTANFTLRVTDSGGLFTETTLTVTVNPDNQPPTITCPAPITQNTDPNVCTAVVTFADPTVTDNCPPCNDGQAKPGKSPATQGCSVVCSPASGSSFQKGVTTVTCTATDASNNTAQCMFTVTVNDTQAPSITCPANVTQPAASGQCSAVVTYSTPTATDNCLGVGTPSCVPASGSTFQKGVTTVTCTVSDASNNPASCTFTITVNDTQPPAITCPANIVQGTDPNVCQAVVTYPAPTVSDICSVVGAPMCAPASGSTFQKGTTTVTCTVKDSSNNMSMCSFLVTVNDTQPPVFPNGCPAGITKAAQATCPITTTLIVTYTTPVATDNCGPAPTVVCNPPSGSIFPPGTTVVTCTATDSSGNTAICTFPVNVYSFCLQDDSSAGNVVFVNAVTGEYLFCQNGVPIASGTGTLVLHGCNFQIDHAKGDRRVHIQGDTSANSGAGSGTAYIQKAGGGFVAQITDRKMTGDACTCSPPVSSPAPGKSSK